MYFLEKNVVLLDRSIRALMYLYALFVPFSSTYSNIVLYLSTFLGGIRVLVSRTGLPLEKNTPTGVLICSFCIVAVTFSATFSRANILQSLETATQIVSPFLLSSLFILPSKRLYYLKLFFFSVFVSSLVAMLQLYSGNEYASSFQKLAKCLPPALIIAAALIFEEYTPKENLRMPVLPILVFLTISFLLISTGNQETWILIAIVLSLYVMMLLFSQQQFLKPILWRLFFIIASLSILSFALFPISLSMIALPFSPIRLNNATTLYIFLLGFVGLHFFRQRLSPFVETRFLSRMAVLMVISHILLTVTSHTSPATYRDVFLWWFLFGLLWWVNKK